MRRIVQLKIPKTASSSIEAGIKMLKSLGVVKFPKSHGHAKPKPIKRVITQRVFEDSFVIASVRNPYDKLVSAYQYIMQAKQDKKETDLKYVFEFPSFTEFCLAIDDIKHLNQFFHNQVDWLLDDEKETFDYLIRYETLAEDWETLVKKFTKQSVPLPTIRKTNRNKWQKYYSDEAKKAVYKSYEEDFYFLKYSS